jgi:uncharacterized membrane protein YccC
MFLADPGNSLPQVSIPRRGAPDLMPGLVNAVRVFISIGVPELFWIATGWPSGVAAVVWSAIFILTLSPNGDQAYAIAKSRLLGVSLAAALGAIVELAVLPGSETFAAQGVALGLVLIPAGALSAPP